MILARAPMQALISPWRERHEAWCKQAAEGARIMDEFASYAEEIGCQCFQDEIIADEIQSRKLAKWWTEHTNG